MALNRRALLKTSLAAAAQAQSQSPAVIARGSVRPVVIASGNGHRYRNGGTQTCIERAFAQMAEGKDVLDALIAGCHDRGIRVVVMGVPARVAREVPDGDLLERWR